MELGIAIEKNLLVIVIGPLENVFCHLPQVLHFKTWDDFLECLPGLHLMVEWKAQKVAP